MAQNPKTNTENIINPAQIIGTALFVVFICGLGAYYLFADFRGLTNNQGIDQAQIAREISRGNGFNTKFLRPFALFQARQKADEAGKTVNLDSFEDTYHAPLGPLVNAAALKIGQKKLVMDIENTLYPGDRIIAIGAVIILLLSMLVYYLLAARIFDRKIGVILVITMVLCDLMWRFTHTGLPTNLLLFLFGFALFFLYKGVESQQLKHPPAIWVALSGAFFGLMALSHWITIWIFLGALVYTALAFRPRGMMAAIMTAVFLVVIMPGLVRNFIISGTIHGDAFYALYNGLGGLGESGAMRNFKPDKETLNLQGFGGRVATTSVSQFKNLIGYFGTMLAAPIFFISLLHPFRRPEIASFRWSILTMWVMALIGMSIFGLPYGETDSNQIHILFAPIMAAYGLAMIAILWNRTGISAANTLARNVPFIIIVLISSISVAVNVPRDLFRPGVFMDRPNYRPYLPRAFVKLNEFTNEKEVIATDMPWGTAWYADRRSVWLPKDNLQFESMVEFFDAKQLPIAGIYFSPVSTNLPLASIMEGDVSDWAYWVIKPQYDFAATRSVRKEGNSRFGVVHPQFGREMSFWSNYDRTSLGRPSDSDLAAQKRREAPVRRPASSDASSPAPKKEEVPASNTPSTQQEKNANQDAPKSAPATP